MDPDLFGDSTAASIYTWRYEMLWEVGYDSQAAELLALGSSDLHQMVEAKKGGCSDEQALRIFS